MQNQHIRKYIYFYNTARELVVQLTDFSLTLAVEVKIYAQMLPLLFREKSSRSTFL